MDKALKTLPIETGVAELAAYRSKRERPAAGTPVVPAWVLPVGVPAPPTGTVTFLLTDIEGSSPRWDTHGEAMAAAVRRHYEILDAAVTAHDGFRPIEQGEGDSMVAAFSRASDAAAAAVDAQCALVAEAWPPEAKLQVRMALHTGEAQLRDELYYVGPTIIRCARLRALAHGGQVLLSAGTAQLLTDVLPLGASLVSLGRHRLKGLRSPEEVHQLAHPDLPPSFPPLPSVEERPTTVPIQLTSFIGRAAELAELADLTGRHRLVSVVGTGGFGKTRLAAQTAAGALGSFDDGVWWVELAEVTDPDQVATTVIAALGLDAGNRTPLDRLTGYLRERRALLVLDNCEQIVSAVAALVEAVLLACPEVSVLATSREPLGVRGEVPWRARPLTLPPAAEEEPTTDQILAAESVQLFADRAAQANAGFRVDAANAATMAAICCRLDGIPLAIELAAARVSVLRPERILDGLGDWFRLLTSSTRGAPERQQTLSASVEWSHNLLSEGERVLLRRLAVFVGAFDLEAAEAVTAADGVTSGDVLPLLIALVDKSLVSFDGEHYVLLQTIRDFATARLEASGEAAATHDAHLRHYQDVAATAAAELSAGPQIATLEHLEAARGNLLAAVDWALDRDDHEAAARVVSDLALFWQLHGRHSESLASIRRVQRALPAAASEVRARVLWAAGQLGLYSMDLPGGYGVAETGAAVQVATETGSDEVLGRALGVQGFMTAFAAPHAAVGVLAAARSAAAAARDAFGIGMAAAYSGFAAVFFCDQPEEAEPHLTALAAQLAATGSPLWAVWQGLIEGMTHWRAGRLPAAAETFMQAEELACALGDPVLESWCAVWGSDALIDAGDLDTAERLIGRSATWMDRSSYGRFEFITSRRIRLELVRGDLGAARAACDAVEVTACEMGFPFVNVEIGLLRARFLLEDGDAAVAATRVAEAVAIADSLGTPWYLVAAANLSGRVTRALGDFARAEQEHHRALALCASHGFAVAAAETLECLASLATAGESWAEAVRLFGSAGALRAQIGAPCPVLDAVLVESDLAAAREALGDDEFQAARAEGAALNLPETAAYAARARGERKRPSIGWESLTQTELRVVDLIADGLTNAAIAEKLFITVGTVKVHLHHVFTKLGITRRAELAARATERRLTTTEAS